MRRFELSRDEFDQLISLISNRPLLVGQLREASVEGPYQISMILDESLLEELGDVLTEELAMRGFDRDYSINSIGEALESFLDFFGP